MGAELNIPPDGKNRGIMSNDPDRTIDEQIAEVDSRRPLRVLIVDDDTVQRQILTKAVLHAGGEVTLATSCREAIVHLDSSGFDCLILDLLLEDGDGMDVCRAMAGSRCPASVIVVSGADPVHRSRARAYARSLGVEVQGLPKPVDLASLRVYLANLGKDSRGLPALHTWGGNAGGRVIDGYRRKACVPRM